MASVIDFKNALLGGGARANQFSVFLNFPSFVDNSAAVKGQFLCTATHLPGSTLGVTNNVYYRGREVKMAGERTFQNWGVTILNDTDFALHNAFNQWSQGINSVVDNTGLTDPESYVSSMTVLHLDRNDQVIKQYTFSDCWPVSVGEIQLGYGTNDQVEEFTVEFAYTFWESV